MHPDETRSGNFIKYSGGLSMKSKVISTIGKSFFWVTVTCSLVYSIAMLGAKPAHADDICTPAECSALQQSGPALCYTYNKGTFLSITCPEGDYGAVHCTGGTLSFECGND